MWYTLTNSYGVHMNFILNTLYMFGLACSSNAESLNTNSRNTIATPAPFWRFNWRKEKWRFAEPQKGLSREGCDNGPGVMGAASYFVGELKISDTSVSGEEEWILFANKKWAATNGGDCTQYDGRSLARKLAPVPAVVVILAFP